MKRLILTAIACLVAYSSSAAILSTNITSPGVVGHLLSTNRASVYSFELSSAYPAQVDFYDCDSLAAPYYGTNYTTAALVAKSVYATNIVSTYVGSSGATNWYTNAGIYTLISTNAAATNALPKMMSGVVGANGYVVYNTDAIFTRGIAIKANTNVSIVINYRSGQ